MRPGTRNSLCKGCNHRLDTNGLVTHLVAVYKGAYFCHTFSLIDTRVDQRKTM